MPKKRNFKKIGTVRTRMIEECSELIKEVCKAERFGLFHSQPGYHKPNKTNAHHIMDEIADVERTCKELKKQIRSDPRWNIS